MAKIEDIMRCYILWGTVLARKATPYAKRPPSHSEKHSHKQMSRRLPYAYTRTPRAHAVAPSSRLMLGAPGTPATIGIRDPRRQPFRSRRIGCPRPSGRPVLDTEGVREVNQTIHGLERDIAILKVGQSGMLMTLVLNSACWMYLFIHG